MSGAGMVAAWEYNASRVRATPASPAVINLTLERTSIVATPEITEAERKAQREAEMRTAAALEQVADTLNGVRGQIDDIAHEVGDIAANTKKGPSVDPPASPREFDPANP